MLAGSRDRHAMAELAQLNWVSRAGVYETQLSLLLQCGMRLRADREGAWTVEPRDFPTNRGGPVPEGLDLRRTPGPSGSPPYAPGARPPFGAAAPRKLG
jgi:hypothetical protein